MLALANQVEVFRIHRDARFSKDPTPYKVFVSHLQDNNYELTVPASFLCCLVCLAPIVDTLRLIEGGRAPEGRALMQPITSTLSPLHPS